MITAKGQHVTIDLNGTRIIDREDPKFDKEGIIALQIHVWPKPMEVRFKDIEIKELVALDSFGSDALPGIILPPLRPGPEHPAPRRTARALRRRVRVLARLQPTDCRSVQSRIASARSARLKPRSRRSRFKLDQRFPSNASRASALSDQLGVDVSAPDQLFTRGMIGKLPPNLLDLGLLLRSLSASPKRLHPRAVFGWRIVQFGLVGSWHDRGSSLKSEGLMVRELRKQ